MTSAAPAHADDAAATAAEIRDLKARLLALEKRLDAQAHSQAQTQAEVARVVARGPLPTTKGAPIEYCPPGKFCYKGLTITPGGFFALEGLWRDHNMESDIDTPFAAVPYPNNAVGHAQEFKWSARQSRLSLLVEGKVDPAWVFAGYGEFDFLGAAQTANFNQSDSFTPRIRHLYAQIDNNAWGGHLLAGQTWSLATLNGFGGIKPRQEQIPLTIDAQYVAGFTWDRTPQLRYVQDVGYNFQIAGSAELPATIIAGSVPTGVVATSANGCGGGAATNPSGDSLINACNTYTLNQMPDLIAKASWDPTFGANKVHVEAYGLLRQFTDETVNTAGTPFPVGNHDTMGGGFGGGIVAQILPGWLDAQFSALTGNGVGRYGTSQLPDVTYSSTTGAFRTVPETMGLAGLIVHAAPWLDIYGYAGEETTGSVFTPGTASGFGWGNPADVQGGCFTNLVTATCTAYKAPKSVGEVTIGFWDTVAKGDYGLVKWGLQYEFIQDQGFAGLSGTAAPGHAPMVTPKADENVVMASVRYYPF
ncbi:MAG TPA: hypothetical protein VGY52_02080 [Roseiarcus sp.]|nr:hypothetical protein [Roseiarcus sp.]